MFARSSFFDLVGVSRCSNEIARALRGNQYHIKSNLARVRPESKRFGPFIAAESRPKAPVYKSFLGSVFSVHRDQGEGVSLPIDRSNSDNRPSLVDTVC